MTESLVVRTMQAQGVATAPFDRVTFALTIIGTGNTSAEAKEDARASVDTASAFIRALPSKDVPIVDGSLRVECQIEPLYVYNGETKQHDFKGYRVTYGMRFQSPAVNMASEIQDRLTSLDKARVEPPNFKVNDLTALQTEAFKDARKRAQARFAAECDAFGIKDDEFDVYSWEARYDESQSAGARPMAAQSVGHSRRMSLSEPRSEGPEPVQLESGIATIFVNLSVVYGKK